MVAACCCGYSDFPSDHYPARAVLALRRQYHRARETWSASAGIVQRESPDVRSATRANGARCAAFLRWQNRLVILWGEATPYPKICITLSSVRGARHPSRRPRIARCSHCVFPHKMLVPPASDTAVSGSRFADRPQSQARQMIGSRNGVEKNSWKLELDLSTTLSCGLFEIQRRGHSTSMESLLAKIFATALALSQVTTTPDAVKTQFDRTRDQEEVARLLGAGCTHMRKAFDIEDINLDELIATAMDDPQAMTSENKAFRGINFADLQTAYRQFCKNEKVPVPAVDLGEVIDHYNKAVADLPDHNKLKGLKLPGASVVLDRKGERFAEVFEENQRRQWVPLSDIPEHVQKAFLAAEDKRFYRHRGIDERGLIRAFIGNLAQSGRPQGGSTITQQIVKNLLVGEDLTYDRKIREMIVASRVEHTLSKAEILELYLNSVYLGRGSWGIELAARSYFGKQAKNLTLEEGALLAGLTKGPNYFNPDRHPGRAQERLA